MSGKRDRKTLLIIRHAHRDTGDRSLDNGLSEKGRRQTERLASYFEMRFDGDRKPLVLSSPKLRCIQTVEPIAVARGRKVRVDPRLDECAARETPEGFFGRIQDLLEWWHEEGPDLTVMCSHGDWIPPAVNVLTGARIEARKGSWAEVREIDGRPTLVWLIQTFKRLK